MSGGEKLYLLGLLLAVMASSLWGTTGPAFRIASQWNLDVVTVNFVRYAVCSLVLFFVIKKRSVGTWNWKRPLFILGSAGMLLSSLGLNVAFLRISIGLSMVIYYSAPCWVMVGSWLLGRHKVTLLQLMAFLMALLGIWKAVGGAKAEGTLDLVGLIAALAAAVGYAMYVLNGHFGPGRDDRLGMYARTFFVATAMMTVLAVCSGRLGVLLYLPLKAWFVLLYLAIFCTLIPYGIFILSLRFISGNAASIATMSEVPFSMMWAFVILSEKPETSAILGGAMVLSGIALMSLDRSDPGKLKTPLHRAKREKGASSPAK